METQNEDVLVAEMQAVMQPDGARMVMLEWRRKYYDAEGNPAVVADGTPCGRVPLYEAPRGEFLRMTAAYQYLQSKKLKEW